MREGSSPSPSANKLTYRKGYKTMKKKIVALVAAAGLAFCLTGCGNRQILDTNFYFNRAIISMPDGTVVDGTIQSWKDFDDGDTIQIKIDDVTYLTHISNVVLMTD